MIAQVTNPMTPDERIGDGHWFAMSCVHCGKRLEDVAGRGTSCASATASERSEGEDKCEVEFALDLSYEGAKDHLLTRFQALRSRLTSLERERGELEKRAQSFHAMRVAEGDRANRAESRVRALEEDAKRMDWLEANNPGPGRLHQWDHFSPTLREAIDAARRQQESKAKRLETRVD